MTRNRILLSAEVHVGGKGRFCMFSAQAIADPNTQDEWKVTVAADYVPTDTFTTGQPLAAVQESYDKWLAEISA